MVYIDKGHLRGTIKDYQCYYIVVRLHGVGTNKDYQCYYIVVRLHGVQCDVTDHESVKEAMAESLQHLGNVYIRLLIHLLTCTQTSIQTHIYQLMNNMKCTMCHY